MHLKSRGLVRLGDMDSEVITQEDINVMKVNVSNISSHIFCCDNEYALFLS